MGFARQGYWSKLPLPSTGDLPNPWIKPMSPTLIWRFFITKPPWASLLEFHVNSNIYYFHFFTLQFYVKFFFSIINGIISECVCVCSCTCVGLREIYIQIIQILIIWIWIIIHTPYALNTFFQLCYFYTFHVFSHALSKVIFIILHCLQKQGRNLWGCTCSNYMCTCSVIQLCPTLFDPMDCSLPGSSVHGISQARILQWIAISYCRGSSWSMAWNCISSVSCIGWWILLPLHHTNHKTIVHPKWNQAMCTLNFFSFIFISWRLITSQYCSGFCHTLKWISHGLTCVPHPEPHLPPPSSFHPSGSSQCTSPKHLSHVSNLDLPSVLEFFNLYTLMDRVYYMQ